MKKFQLLLVFMCVVYISGFSQSDEEINYTPVKLSGPRAGLTYIGGDLGEKMKLGGINQYISQFGWQFETRYFETKEGFQGLVETVVLLGGFETEKPVLSGTLLVGFRTKSGFEAGAGPNLSTANGGTTSFVFAVGHTAKTEGVYIPVNFAIAPSKDAMKFTFLVGFIIRRKDI